MNASTAQFQTLATQAKSVRTAADFDAVETRMLVRAFWRRRKLIVGLSLGIGLLIWLAMQQVTPTYTVFAKLMPDIRKAQIVGRNEVVADVIPSEQIVNSEIAVLRSNIVIEEMLSRLTPAQRDKLDPALQPKPLKTRAKLLVKRLIVGAPPQPGAEAAAAARQARMIDTVRGMRRTYTETDSYVMTVRVDATDPALARDIANGLVDSYIDLQLENRREAVGQATIWLEQRLDELKVQVEASERAVAKFQSQRLIEDGGTLETVSQQLTEMNSKLAALRAERVEALARLDQLVSVLQDRRFDAAAHIVDTPTMQELAQQQLELQQNDAVWARSFDANHKRRTDIQKKLAEIRTVMEVELKNAIAVQQTEVEVARDREAGLASQIKALEGKLIQMTDNSLGLRQLNREANAARQIYESLLVRIAEARAQKELQQPDSVLVEHAIRPEVPSAPRPTLLATLGVVVTCALVSAWVLFSEMSPTTYRSAQELEGTTGLPVLTSLPAESWSGTREMLELLQIDPYSLFAERIRKLRAALTMRPSLSDRGQSVMVLASSPGEGKTATMLALAEITALSGRTAIVVDCDLRRPKVLSALGLAHSRQPDFAEFIAGDCALPDAIHSPEDHGFDVLAARERSQDAVDALSVQWLGPVLRELEQKYDFVFVDAPALLSVPDAMVVAQEVDSRFYLVGCDQTTRVAVKRGLATLAEIGVGVRGMILNRVDLRNSPDPLEEEHGYGY